MPSKAVNSSRTATNGHNIIFGEAHAFYQVKIASEAESRNHLLVIYTPLGQLERILNIPRGQWSTNLAVINTADILDIVGIWVAETSKKVYILRKHPGLAMLSAEECGIEEASDDEEEKVD